MHELQLDQLTDCRGSWGVAEAWSVCVYKGR